ncbi:S8 family serine peptidase [Ornithinibacillus sp. BX22]|uniref:S8 family serine peptidase n=2 Tax=Ornithinibacillus TaxID=484508 RepID=A0A923L393_9BACI|nr:MULTISPECIES: S8 family serine peptidase [Ornithinibacillus]MBC5635679.1 S8 family serine peptidase [Ornithinibacillus hominis]MBS3679290.1 S8 family serine peptidase [Ornithinibacillus massiliensis]
MLKRISVLSLIFLLAFSTVTFAAPGDIVVDRNLEKSDLSKELAETIDPNEIVRVTVEIDGEAPIEKATKQGKKFGDLSVAEKKKLLNEAKEKKNKAKKAMKDKKINAKVLHEFDTVVNGFSAEVKYSDMEELEKLPNVKSVVISTKYERPIDEPNMANSKELVQAQQAWRDYGFKGEGMVIGVIDSGVDHTHQDMVLSEGVSVALSEEDVNQKIQSEGLPGQYYTEKVPYGYNYMDQNHNYTDNYPGASSHGMHVAGTVGANGEANGGIDGIAPDAQILNFKVFGNDPGMQYTYGDIYIAAIDDGIKLGADVLNMSLGSASGFVDSQNPEQLAVTRAVENGIVMSISAGNSALFADGFFYPYASNPDYGVSGSPGLAYDSLQVASFENSFMTIDALQFAIEGGESGVAAYMSSSQTDPVVGNTYELVEAGLGHPEDYEGKDLEGKYALVQRGEIDFVTKALNAQEAGASGVIVYNNTDGMVNMATDPTIVIPQVFLSKADGDKLRDALLNGQTASVTFTGEQTSVPNAEAGQMSEFSSWGLTPNLDFKPEITAPGGQIYSTLNNGEYGVKSGTSMAAPHVSGGSALVLERVDNEFGFEGRNRVELAKNILMNTSTPVEFDGAFVSPRRQGAGLMQLHSALSTPVVVTNAETGEAKVALKEIADNQVTFELTAENYSDEAVSYEVRANAQTDTPVSASGFMVTAPNLLGALDLGAVTTVNGEASSTVEVPANGTTTFEVTVDVSEWDEDLQSIFTSGYWLEGFVTLTDPTDTNPELTIPYVGFKGAWDEAPIFDAPLWDPMSYYEMTGVVTTVNQGSYDYLGQDATNLAFSPNGNGVRDDVGLILSFLRNAKEVSFNVLDKDGNLVETIYTESNIRKDYYDSGRASYYKVSSDWMWDGTIDGNVAPDGQYYLQAVGVIDYEGAREQSIEIPVLLDTQAPTVTSDIRRGKREALIMVEDGQGSGVSEFEIKVNGEPIEIPEGETQQLITDLHPSSVVEVTVTDNAGNTTYERVMGPQGKAKGKVKVLQ